MCTYQYCDPTYPFLAKWPNAVGNARIPKPNTNETAKYHASRSVASALSSLEPQDEGCHSLTTFAGVGVEDDRESQIDGDTRAEAVSTRT